MFDYKKINKKTFLIRIFFVILLNEKQKQLSKMKTIVTITKGAEVLMTESFTSKKQAENFINKFKASTPVMQRTKERISIFTR